MSDQTRKLSRREQSQTELEYLRGDVTAWLKHRRSQDPLGQYKTQLDSLESLLVGALNEIQCAASNISTSQTLGELFEECELYDIRGLWVRRIWYYFRTKFDQRDDPLIGPMLRAADEVIWSCYYPVFATASNLGHDIKQGPVPLPFIESLYSPFAKPVELVRRELNYGVDTAFLTDFLEKIPVPVMGLPPMCVRSPWWLVYVGHEAGHFVQYHLLQNIGLVGAFRQALQKTVKQHSTDANAPDRWGKWSEEVFADAFSVACMGQWAVDAMAELTAKSDDDMARPDARYPAPAIRLKLLGRLAQRLNLPTSAAPDGAWLDAIIGAHAILAEDDGLIPHVVECCLGPLPVVGAGLATLTELSANDFLPGGAVYNWQTSLSAAGNTWQPPAVVRSRSNARLFVTASLAAWRDATGGAAHTNLASLRSILAERTLRAIDAGRELGTRATGPAAPTDVGADFAELLLKSSRSRLAGGVES